MKQATVSAGLAASILSFAVAKGAERGPLLRAVGLLQEDLEDQDSRVEFDTYVALIRAAKAATGDPALPLNHAVETRLEKMTVVGLIVHSSASPLDAMKQLNRYASLMVEVDVMEHGERFSVNAKGPEVWITDNRPDPNRTPEITEAALGRFIGEFRRGFPDDPFATEVEVTHAPPLHALEYERILQCPVTFNAARNALQIAPKWLTKKFDGTSGYVFGIFAEKADALLADLEKRDSLKARIEGLLVDCRQDLTRVCH